ncbi:MAG: hypothetical protein ACJ77M_07410 [Thermoleophilaceae bacterium]|jgi:hypothetical protein
MVRTVSSIVVLVAAATAAGCGATPPQVPRPDVSLLAHAISELGVHCGHAQVATALVKDERSVRELDAAARVNVRQLVAVLRNGPDRIYQGETVSAIARDESTDLDKCGLHSSAALLGAAAQ